MARRLTDVAERNPTRVSQGGGDDLDDGFACVICLGTLNDPHLCPHCSKLFCHPCIVAWLQNNLRVQKCPNCKAELRISMLVKVRWFGEVEKLQKLQRRSLGGAPAAAPEEQISIDSARDLCLKHNRTITFYCCLCRLCICEECAAKDTRHQNHVFKALDMVYRKGVQTVERELQMVARKERHLKATIDKLDRNINLIKAIKNAQIAAFRKELERSTKEIERSTLEKISKLNGCKHGIEREIQAIDKTMKDLKAEIRDSSKSQFVLKQPAIFIQCNKIVEKAVDDERIPHTFRNIIAPAPGSFEIGQSRICVIGKFTAILQNSVACSKDFKDAAGRNWRVVIWTNSSRIKLSISLELLDGSPCWIDCHFSIIHADHRKVLRGDFKHYFDRSKSKRGGILDFIPLRTIYDGNYLTEHDTLEMMCHMREFKLHSRAVAV